MTMSIAPLDRDAMTAPASRPSVKTAEEGRMSDRSLADDLSIVALDWRRGLTPIQRLSQIAFLKSGAAFGSQLVA